MKCPFDGSTLIKDNDISFDLDCKIKYTTSMKKCVKCGKKFIFSFLFNNGQLVSSQDNLKDKIYNYYTQSMEKTLIKKRLYNKKSNIIKRPIYRYTYLKNKKKIKAYIYSALDKCIICNGELTNLEVLLPENNTKLKTIKGLKCINCGANYFTNSEYREKVIKRINLKDNKNQEKEKLKSLLQKYIDAIENVTNVVYFHANSNKLDTKEVQNHIDRINNYLNETKNSNIYCFCKIKNLTTNEFEEIYISQNDYKKGRKQGRFINPKKVLAQLCIIAIRKNLDSFSCDDNLYNLVYYIVFDGDYLKNVHISNRIIENNNKAHKQKAHKQSNSYQIERNGATRSVNHQKEITSPEDVTEIYVYYKLKNICVTNKHNVISETLLLTNILNEQDIMFNVYHCLDCDEYFINYEVLQNYFSKGVFPDIRYVIMSEEDNQWKSKSTLFMYGYNVKNGNLTENQRQKILSYIIDNNIMTKHEIIRNIQSKVDYNGRKKGNEAAKEKWEKDILFVSRYSTKNQNIVKNPKFTRK